MLNHCEYDKIKLIHELSSLVWFIQQHAQQDAQSANDVQCYELVKKLSDDLEQYVHKLREIL